MAEYKVNYTQSNFTGGIIAAELYGRNDFNKVKTGMKKCTNWTIREAGGLEFRRGTRFEQLIPNTVGAKAKLASLGNTLFLFGETDIKYYKSDGSWGALPYQQTPADLDKLRFTELQRKLYFYDGTIDLAEIYFSGGVPAIRKTHFESSLTGVLLDSETLGALPDVSVLVDHTYTISLAKDQDHEGIVLDDSTTQHTNAELGQAADTEDNKAVQVNVKVNLAGFMNSLSEEEREEYLQGKIFIYKKYQGYFYFLSAIDIANWYDYIMVDVSGTNTRYDPVFDNNLPYLWAWKDTSNNVYFTDASSPRIGATIYKYQGSAVVEAGECITDAYEYEGDFCVRVTINNVDMTLTMEENGQDDRSAIYAWKKTGTNDIEYTKDPDPSAGALTYNNIMQQQHTISSYHTYNYLFEDNGQVSVDTSKTPKDNPFYLNLDGTVSKVSSIADYGQRLFLTQSNQDVTRIIYSAIGNTANLAFSVQRDEAEAGNLELPISNFDSWCKVVSGLDLILSTSYTINKVSGTGTLTTDTILWDGMSKEVEPVKTRRSMIYTNGSNRNIYDLTYNEYGQYDSIDLTLLVKYIFEQKTIKRLAFKDFPVKTIYVLCSDGDLYCLTYIKDQNIYAWYRIEHAGTIEDLHIINTDTEDEIFMIVNYGTHRVLERAYHRTDNVYLDCSVEKRLSEIEKTTVDGVEYYSITDLSSVFNDKQVRVFDTGNNKYLGDYDIMNPQTVVEGGKVVEIDDLDFNGYTVSDGTLLIPVADTDGFEGNIKIGFPYYAVMETIPLEFQDANGNSTIGRKKAVNDAYLRYGDSRGLTYKTQGHEYDCGICERDAADDAQFLERGQVRLNTVSEYKWDSTIKILQRQPYPARIESITLGITFNDKS